MSDDARTLRVKQSEVGPSPTEEKTQRVPRQTATTSLPAVTRDEDAIGTLRVGAQPREDQADIPTRHVGGQAQGGAAKATRGVRHPLGTLNAGATLCGDCTVAETLHPHESGRPGLYICDAPEGRVVVKVAALDFPPKAELWNRLPILQHPHVLRTFRIMEEGGFFYEVQEFCSGGTLNDLVPHPGSDRNPPPLDWIENQVVPAFHKGIKYLHENDIVHRDIKPSNLYIREEDAGSRALKRLVIGDFDISSVLETGRTSRNTDRAGGTWNYSAPEAFPRFVDDHAGRIGGSITRASDYYSFGVVLIELLLGTTSLHQAKLPDLFDFYLNGGRVAIPEKSATGEKVSPRLSELLHGLLLRNRTLRWSADEVERWLGDHTTDEDRKRIREDSGYQLGRSSQPFTAFEGSKPVDLISLAEAMAHEPEVAKEELLEGDVMMNWIGNLDARVARQIRQDRDEWRHLPDVALFHAMLRCDPTRPFPFAAGGEAHSAEEWSNIALSLVSEGRAQAFGIGNAVILQTLEAWLRLKSEPETDLADGVAQIRAQWWGDSPKADDAKKTGKKDKKPAADEKSEAKAKVVFEEIACLFQPMRPYAIADAVVARTPQEIARLTYGQPQEWASGCTPVYAASMQRWEEGYLQAWLRQRLRDENGQISPLVAQCEKVQKEMADAPSAAFETTLRLLDPELPPVQVEIDKTPIQSGFLATFGETATRTLSYTTIGPGIPYGALKLQLAQPGLQLGEHLIRKRQGSIELKMESKNEIPVSRPFQARLALESQYTQLVDHQVPISYGVMFPTAGTLSRIAAGAAIGAGFMGGARLLIMGVGAARPIGASDLAFDRLWDETVKGNFPGAGLLIAGVLLGTFGYGAFRTWLWALREHAQG
jgi:serine/threonine protein kinase